MTFQQSDYPIIKNLYLLMEAIANVENIFYANLFFCGREDCGRSLARPLAYLYINIVNGNDDTIDNQILALCGVDGCSLWHTVNTEDYAGHKEHKFTVKDFDHPEEAAGYIEWAARTGKINIDGFGAEWND